MRSNSSSEPLGRDIWVVAMVVVLGAVMAVLDTTIVNVALHTLSDDLDTGLSTVQWTVTGYFLAMGLVIPFAGWGSEHFGVKPLWLLSLGLFIAGSVLSGAAWSIGSLIAFRVVQGLGGGMIMPLAQTILATAAGPARMGRVMSVIGVPMLLGPVLGPVLGGWLVDYDWRWIFYVNAPVGVAAFTVALRLLPDTRPVPGAAGKLDTRGFALLAGALVLALYGLSRAGTDGFDDPAAIACLGAAVVLGVLFSVSALRLGGRALIDLRLFADRTFSAAAVTTFLFSVGLFGSMLLLPLFYQTAKGESALTAGLLLAPQGFGAALAMPVAGILTDRIGAGRVVPVGVTLALLGTVVYTQVTPDTSYGLLAAALVLRGFGLGAVMTPALSSAYATLSKEAVPRASSTVTILQQVGGSFGSAVIAVVLSGRISAELPGGRPAEGPLVTAFAQTFWVAFGLAALIYLPALLLPRHGTDRAAPAEEESTHSP
ncbi:MDR family MFS transporter [Streptomyces niveiscabiei]|uniref:MDR family MFS transporter n=1 Tax=Streptomyces niveiscabiei TaxID=164115 RepID=UPI0029AA1837|nr:MDR family MFS transporter [Streptomyces niveiscabiei]MDX3386233.1 MDR family MFS transporter [Streptomyces niveiscabiei]